MATMIPENVERFTTEGERQFYKFLEFVAKPDSQNIVWYSPDINGREPDFILYSHLIYIALKQHKSLICLFKASCTRFFLDRTAEL
ncbi:MAG: hypothetical protein JRD87_06615 [Deltaproteobacteria bacterium]|jgi:hypothetical protein|nr:hypothetical protein [Deltaproteobacteria bacterium]MBW2237438.1 hypothetical protein [Deltaproteobacteria bacterium]MBW2572118.1 hypothetical protein [Deltaproteobacteria bacterium]MBW2669548.1 hypothetical protein [Deltaproteobacteria bacterium]